MLLKLQKYHVEVRNKKGKELVVADALSRNYPPYKVSSNDTDNEIPICMVTCLPMSAERIEELQRKTANDPTMQTLAKTICNGWPDNRADLPTNMKQFKNN